MGNLSAMQIEDWQSAIGREKRESEVLGERELRRFARAIGLPDDTDEVPLAHWAFFLPSPADADIGPDGHPRRGDFLPAISLPRRMFAAAAIGFDAPLEIGAEAEMITRIADVAHKAGRTGDLVFVEVEKTLSQQGAVRVRERQTYVYREMGARVPLPAPAGETSAGELWQPDEVNLFRFSAATGNAHRIHYDLPYARDVEGYPALIVHGPFTAARLARLAMRQGTLAEFSFRALAPLFVGQDIRLQRSATGEYEAIRCDGVPAMRASAAYR